MAVITDRWGRVEMLSNEEFERRCARPEDRSGDLSLRLKCLDLVAADRYETRSRADIALPRWGATADLKVLLRAATRMVAASNS